MKLACVIHRFGAEVAGGSETHCRLIAGQLAARHEVTILTTCAKDHVSWRNEYPDGESRDGALAVRRFPVVRPRELDRFSEISKSVFTGAASETEQEEWFRANGPEAPALLEFLAAHGAEFDLILFWSFRYYHSYFGLPLVADRAILVPTAEEDHVMRLDVLGRFFTRPAGFVFLTPEEEALVARRAAGPLAPSCIIGSGLEIAPRTVDGALEALGLREPFVLYLGRIEPSKGCATLLNHFLKWRDGTSTAVPLVMAGPANMPLPDDARVIRLGYVDHTAREALLAKASVLVVPSPYESLSIVLLEAWNHGVPALVNGRCSVLKGQAVRAGGALYYTSFGEFARCLDHLLTHPDVARQLGLQGQSYVNREYRWPQVIRTLEAFLTSFRAVTPGLAS